MLEPPPPVESQIPDWQTISKEVVCPLCDYNLRGLTQNRCPECGYTFDWHEVLNPEVLQHPWLFEHARRRKTRSFFRTLIEGLRPRHFWKSVRATHQPRPRHLLLYWILAFILVIWLPVGLFIRQAVDMYRDVQQWRASETRWLNDPSYANRKQRIINAWGSVNAYLDSKYPTFWSTTYAQIVWTQGMLGKRTSPGYFYGRTRGVAQTIPTILTLIAWPWATFCTLMIFLVSMHKANVRPIHVLRCVIYSCDAIWLAMLAFLLIPDLYSLPEVLVHYGRAIGDAGLLQLLVGFFFSLIVCYRLAAAYRLYLKFPHAIATAVASQVLVLLMLAIVVLNTRWGWM